MSQHYDSAGWFLVCSLFHCCVLHSLFDYNLFTIVDIDALGAGLAAEADAVEGVPCFAVEGHFARLGVERADGGSLAAGRNEFDGDALRQFLSSCCAASHSAGGGIVGLVARPHQVARRGADLRAVLRPHEFASLDGSLVVIYSLHLLSRSCKAIHLAEFAYVLCWMFAVRAVVPVARLVGADEVPFVPGKIRGAVIRLYLCAAAVVLGEDGDAVAVILDVDVLQVVLIRMWHRAHSGHEEVRMVGLHRGHFVGIITAYLVHLGRPFARLRVRWMPLNS